MFKLQFPERDIEVWAARYEVPREERHLMDVEAPRVRTRGSMSREQFLRFCHWKTPRSQKQCRRNSQGLVADTTRVAFAAKREELKIGALRILAGVEWPTASVLLHMCDRAPYPILDVRALQSVGVTSPPPYTFEFWWEYTQYVRALARRNRCTMRVVDRALWQYSKERTDGV